MNLKNISIAAVVMSSLSAGSVSHAMTAISVGVDFKAYVTMLNGRNGHAMRNSSFSDEPEFMGYRTPIEGQMVIDITESGMKGRASFEPFLFLGSMSSGRDVTFEPVDSLYGTPVPTNSLMIGNMLFSWGEFYTGIPVSIVFDMGNLSTALRESSVGDVITGMMRGASENTVFTLPDGTQTTLPMGPVIAATTTWDTTDVDTDGDGEPGPIVKGTNPSGTIPLLVDTVLDVTNGDVGIGGSPIRGVAFVGFSPNFDIHEMTVTCVGALGSCDEGQLLDDTLGELDATLSAEELEPVQDEGGSLINSTGL